MVLKKRNCARVKVYCRLKPTLSERRSIEYTLSKRYKNGSLTMYLKNKNIKAENSKYKFHDVFPSTSSQSLVFETVASPMIDKFVQKGENCTIFSYGQTGSGKTYTICGSKLVKDRGIIHQTIDRLFDLTQASSSGAEYVINVSFVEIHNNSVQDLAMPGDPKNKIEPHKILVTNKSEAIKLFEEIVSKRKTTATNKNENSSRSHFICTIHLCKINCQRFNAQFKLVDLAGSEDYCSIDSNTSSQIEALSIKKSLFTLKKITRLLANPGSKCIIPYRDSKLTYELRSTLERKCHVAMIANVDSNDQCLEELVNTFEYAREVASIKKFPVNSLKRAPSFEMDKTQLLEIRIKNLKTEIVELKAKNENVTRENALLKQQNDLFNINRKYRESSHSESKKALAVDPASTLPAGSSVIQKDCNNMAPKRNRGHLKLYFLNNCLGHFVFGDGKRRKTVLLEDDGDCGPWERHGEWRPYDRGCYHKARCPGAAVCGFCAPRLRPVATAAGGPGRLYHYLACQQRISGRPCVGHRGAKRANFLVPGAAAAAAAAAATAEAPPRPLSPPFSSPRPDASEWLPYGRDWYHEVRCRRSDDRACAECDYGLAREPAAADGDGRPRYVHYVWCPKKMNGRPCDEDSGVIPEPNAAGAVETTEPNAAGTVDMTVEFAGPNAAGTAKQSEPDVAETVKNSEPNVAETVKNSEPNVAETVKNPEPNVARTVKFAGPDAARTAKKSEPNVARTVKFSGPNAARTRPADPVPVRRPQRARDCEPPQSRTKKIEQPRPRASLVKRTLPPPVVEVDSVDYYEALLKSMEVPTKYTLRK